MELILLQRVENLGDLGDKVSVKPGYARNFLLPSGRAQAATKANLAAFESLRAELEAAARTRLSDAQRRAEQLSDLHITITALASGEGKLFGSVGAADIAGALTDAGAPVSKNEIRMPEGQLRSLGEYEIGIHLLSDVDAVIVVEVLAAE